MYYSPVIVFAYNRLRHLTKTINSLKKNIYANQTTLIIYLDYPKSKEEMYDYLLVKNFCKKIKGFKKKELVLRKKNFGLSKNIISALDLEIQKYKSLIILEDDMVCDKYFLKYMNFFLNAYKNNKKIVSIHGYNYPLKNKKKLNDFFFLKGADCWGWGTWPSKWKIYSKNTKLIFIGDALMSPYEITYPGGSVEHWNEKPGVFYINKLVNYFDKVVWLNPEQRQNWQYAQSTMILRDLVKKNMFQMNLKGIESAMKNLI